jgi:hypothetical protein
MWHTHGMVFTRALINRLRMVAIELGMWRSGRDGGASGSITSITGVNYDDEFLSLAHSHAH